MNGNDCIDLLQQMVRVSSFSREEGGTADLLYSFLEGRGVEVNRQHNNVWAVNKYFDSSRPSILLNSHHDTVRPNSGYTRDPFDGAIEDGRLYGLGSNDAGGSVVSLLGAFLHFYECQGLRYNLVLALSGEEECSGSNGVEALLPILRAKCGVGGIAFAIVGEPTKMQMAIAERGLMVLDCVAHGRAGHAARNEGDNAIYRAVKDIEWISGYKFDRVSPLFGEVKMSVTVIEAGSQHNVVPAECRFTVDVRVSEMYSNEEVLNIVRANVGSSVTARSVRLRPSSIPVDHPIVRVGLRMGLETYGSPTTSDAALMDGIAALKMGAGDSARSHSADEFIFVDEVHQALGQYIAMLEEVAGASSY